MKLGSDKPLLFVGLFLNIALMIYVYFLKNGGPASLQQGGDWLAIWNEVPMTFLFFLAAIIKPYLMVWARCRKNFDLIFQAGAVMLFTTAPACLIAILAQQALTRDLTMYINWALLWGASTYFALIPQRSLAGEA